MDGFFERLAKGEKVNQCQGIFPFQSILTRSRVVGCRQPDNIGFERFNEFRARYSRSRLASIVTSAVRGRFPSK